MEVAAPTEVCELRKKWVTAIQGHCLGINAAYSAALYKAKQNNDIDPNESVPFSDVKEILRGPIKTWTGQKDWASSQFQTALTIARYCVEYAQEQKVHKHRLLTL